MRLPVRLFGNVVLTDKRLLFSGRFWVPRTPSRLWAVNDALVGGSNYAQRAAQFVESRRSHAVGECDLDWIYAVQLERNDSEVVRAGNAPNIGFVTVQGESLSCVSARPMDTPSPPWNVYLERAQLIVRSIASARRHHCQPANDDTLQRLIHETRYDASRPTCVGWEIPDSEPVPTH